MGHADLIVGFGAIGAAIVQRTNALAASFAVTGVGSVSIMAMGADDEFSACVGDGGHATIRVPLQPLLGEGFVGQGEVRHASPGQPSQHALESEDVCDLSPDTLTEHSVDAVRRSFAIASRAGRLRALEEHLDRLLLVGGSVPEGGGVCVRMVGALGDSMFAGALEGTARYIHSYVRRRYHGVSLSVEGWLLRQEVLFDCAHSQEMRTRLDENAACALATTTVCAEPYGGGPETAEPLFSDVHTLGLTNVDGGRLRGVDDYCTELAGILLVDCIRGRHGHGGGPGHVPCVGVSVLRFPGPALRQAVVCLKALESVSWWHDIDDLWSVGGWSDYDSIGMRLGTFYRREAHRRARKDRASTYAVALGRLTDVVGTGEGDVDDADRIVARALLSGAEAAAREWVRAFLDGGSAELGLDLSGTSLELATLSKGKRSGASREMTSVADERATLRRAASQLGEAIDFFEGRLGEIAAHAAHAAFEPAPGGVGDHGVAWRRALDPGIEASLHPVAVRCVLYALRDILEDREGDDAGHQITGNARSDAFFSEVRGGMAHASELLGGSGVATPEDESSRFETRSGLDRAREELRDVRTRLEEWAQAVAVSRFVDEARTRAEELSATYEDFFATLRILERELEDERSAIMGSLSGRGTRGSACRDVCADQQSLRELLARADESVEEPCHPWGRLLVGLSACEKGLPSRARRSSEARRRDTEMLALARSCIVDEWRKGLSPGSGEGASLFDMSLLEAMELECVTHASSRDVQGILGEAKWIARPFGTPANGCVDTADHILCGAGTGLLREVSAAFVETVEVEGACDDMALVFRTSAGRLQSD